MEMPKEFYSLYSDDAYMSERQLDFFRQRLLDWREQLTRESHSSLQRIRTSESEGGDLIDRSVQDNNRTLDFIARRRNEEMIRKINASLRRLDEGTYGYCLESGEEIGLERLLAYPVATLSVEAQEIFERRQRARQPMLSR